MPDPGADEPDVVIPVSEERLVVDRVCRAEGGVRVRTIVHREEQLVDIPLLHSEVSVRRVAVDRWVDARVADRREGETLIISLDREVPVIVNRLQVHEELHIETRSREELRRESVTVRREEAVVEDLPAKDATAAVDKEQA